MNNKLKNQYKNLLEKKIINESAPPRPRIRINPTRYRNWPWIKDETYHLLGNIKPPGRSAYLDVYDQWRGGFWNKHWWDLSKANPDRQIWIKEKFYKDYGGFILKDLQVYGNPPRWLILGENGIYTITPDGMVPINMPDGWQWGDTLPDDFFNPNNLENIIDNDSGRPVHFVRPGLMAPVIAPFIPSDASEDPYGTFPSFPGNVQPPNAPLPQLPPNLLPINPNDPQLNPGLFGG